MLKYELFIEAAGKKDNEDSGDDSIENLMLALIVLSILTIAYIQTETGFLTNLCSSVMQAEMDTTLTVALAT